MNSKITLSLWLLVGLLNGCAQLPTPSSPALQSAWQIHQTRLNAIQAWRLNGSIAMATEEKNWTARVHWQQQGPVYQLRFNAPLGQGAMRLDGNSDRVIMRTAKNETFMAHNPDALIVQTMGLEIPVTHLYYWIRGLSAPQPAPLNYTFNDTGHLHTLTQDGWQVEYVAYMEANRINLPKKIYLYNSHFEVTIVISQWELKD